VKSLAVSIFRIHRIGLARNSEHTVCIRREPLLFGGVEGFAASWFPAAGAQEQIIESGRGMRPVDGSTLTCLPVGRIIEPWDASFFYFGSLSLPWPVRVFAAVP
jgi:hypothetical protein